MWDANRHLMIFRGPPKTLWISKFKDAQFLYKMVRVIHNYCIFSIRHVILILLIITNLPKYHLICLGSVWYTINSSFVFWSFLNHLIVQIFSICIGWICPDKESWARMDTPCPFSSSVCWGVLGRRRLRTISPTTRILISTELHPSTVLLNFVLSLGSVVYSFYPD